MRYRLTCLSPTLVGDGQKLSPIDYMVWKDHVNVLDQRRIFRLLSKGPRLDGYLAQIEKAERLDFASWGGFAQNFAGRRIPFEHASSIAAWERAQAPQLFIPTFVSNHLGPYLPATTIKGALRTGVVFGRWSDDTLRDVANRMEDRAPRNPAQRAEDSALGTSKNPMRAVSAGDSAAISHSGMKVFLLRVSTLVAKGQGNFELGWKSLRGSTDSRRIEESTPAFAEMTPAGTVFEGSWSEKSLEDRDRIFAAANRYAASQLSRHMDYAASTGLTTLHANLSRLRERLNEASAQQNSCILSLGWGGGLLSKVAVEDTGNTDYRRVVRQYPYYQKAVQTGMPFPKTRRIIFEGGQPASLPGWVLLEIT